MKHICLTALLVAAAGGAARGHFVFVVPAADFSSLKVVMSESLEPDESVALGPVAALKLTARSLNGRDSSTQLTARDNLLDGPASPRSVVFGSLDYGVTARGDQSFLLKYHPKAIVGGVPVKNWTVGGLVAEVVPEVTGKQVHFRVLSRGKPVAAASVTIIQPDGSTTKVETDADGRTRGFAPSGRYGAWARVVENESGEHAGKAYSQVRHYPTLVFDYPDLPNLPEAVSSFGAAATGECVYVYGGHRARVHSYDTSAVTGTLHRLALGRPAEWESLPAGPPLQGLALVAHDGRLIRVGGMAPHNAPGTKADNRSTDSAAIFDPTANEWRPLPKLPQPRSSHDAAVVGDTLVVVGGWNMRGPDGDDWFDKALALDLRRPDSGWVEMPQPFRRRALQAAAIGGKVFVVGGLDEDGSILTTVDVLDVATKTWTSGPPLPGKGRAGFSPAVSAVSGRLVVSAGDGTVVRLSADGLRWEPIAKVAPRVVHRAVRGDGNSVILLGGAYAGINLDGVERIGLSDPKEGQR